LFGSRFGCAQTAEPSSKNAGEISIVLWVAAQELHHSAIQTKKVLHFGGFSHQITVRQPIGRQDSMQTVIQTSRLGSILHDAAQGSCFKYSRVKLKN
jgi:hypothetical protein